MTLSGLLKHLALVEDEYFSRLLRGRELVAPVLAAVVAMLWLRCRGLR
jgi:hypothetical protein